MKLPKLLVLFLALSMILVQSCTPSIHQNQPTAAPTRAQAPSPAAKVTFPALSPQPAPTQLLITPTPAVPTQTHTLAGLYQANVDSNQWAAGDGLALLLGLITGETKIEQVPGGNQVRNTEITGLLIIANAFLQKNPTGAAHDKVQQALSRLIAPLDRLPQFSKPGNLKAFLSESAQVDLPRGPTLVQDRPISFHTGRQPVSESSSRLRQSQIDCQALWSDGFTTAATPLICFEYAETTIGGTHIKLYYPSYWPAGDPRMHQLSVILQAAKKSVETYNPYGPHSMPDISMVITELPYNDASGNIHSSTDAAADQVDGRPNDCYVAVFPGIFAQSDGYMQQVIAHELFHCYEYRSLSDQISGPEFNATQWWVEGGAEFFGNVVYPANNAEYIFLHDLDEDIPVRVLVQFSYDTFIFWQYLENRPDMGISGILRLMRSLPTRGGARDQLNSLAAFPNIDQIFHEFCEALVDGRIKDSSGSFIPYQPEPVHESYIGAPDSTAVFQAIPFLVGFARVHLAGRKDYTLHVVVTGGPPGIYHVELPSASGTWSLMPDHTSVSCGESVYNVLVTQGRAVAGDDYSVQFNATWQTSAEACDSCLLGAWRMEDSSYMNVLNQMVSQKVGNAIRYIDITGEDLVTFTADMHMTQGIDALRILAMLSVPSGNGTDTSHVLENHISGESSTTYSGAHGQLTFGVNRANLIITTMMDGQSLGVPVDTGPLASGPLDSGGAYICTEDTLQIVPSFPEYINLPPLKFAKVR
jgi:hypothetical protein